MNTAIIMAFAGVLALPLAAVPEPAVVLVQDGAPLPKFVRDTVASYRAECADAGTPIPRGTDLVRVVDLNRDGRPDYIIDLTTAGCTGFCGSRGCSVDVFASTPRGRYKENGFIMYEATSASFRCGKSGECDIR